MKIFLVHDYNGKPMPATLSVLNVPDAQANAACLVCKVIPGTVWADLKRLGFTVHTYTNLPAPLPVPQPRVPTWQEMEAAHWTKEAIEYPSTQRHQRVSYNRDDGTFIMFSIYRQVGGAYIVEGFSTGPQ